MMIDGCSVLLLILSGLSLASVFDAERRDRRLRRAAALGLVFALCGGSASLAEPPDRTSSFHGLVLAESGTLDEGLEVSASVDGVELATAPAFHVLGTLAAYRLDLPVDDPATPGTEGGADGQLVSFRVGGADIPTTATFTSSSYQSLDLQVPSAADLVVTLDNGSDALEPGQSSTWTVTVENLGAGEASGIELAVSFPSLADFVTASDGGIASGTLVTWPAFGLAEGDSTTRTLTLEVATPLSVDALSLAIEATVADDGSRGLDPDLSNNRARDLDTLEGRPDLAVTLTNGSSSLAPGTYSDYVLTVSNSGPRDARSVDLSAELPAGVLFQTADADGGELVPGAVLWPAFDLAAGVSVGRTFRVWVPADLAPTIEQLSAVARAWAANGPDADPVDNVATDLTTVEQSAELVASDLDTTFLLTDAQTLEIGGSVTVEVINNGNLDIEVPFMVTVFEDPDGQGEYDAATDVSLGSTLHVGGPAVGGSVQVEVQVAGRVSFRDAVLRAFVDSADEIPEPNEENNLVSTSLDCVRLPSPRSFDPIVETSWPAEDSNLEEPNAKESLSTPIVVQLTDDNGDGRIDAGDSPDLVFVAADLVDPLNPKLRLRAIDGATGRSHWAVLPPVSDGLTFALSGLAAGDLDNDGDVEIVVSTPAPPLQGTGFSNHWTAYDHRGIELWQSDAFVTHPTGSTFTNRDHPTLADLDGDGFSEIVVGGNAFDRFGNLLWAGTGGQGYQSARNADGVDSGAISIVVDLDMDGTPEVMAGNTAYRADGQVYWQSPQADGYAAVGNFDGDDFPEVVVVARGTVRLHEHDGSLAWGPNDLPGVEPNAGGAPTVADFDGDGLPEIGVAGSDFYTVFESDGTAKWQKAVRDESSNQTGSTVFDFDGDGRAEVVYRDEAHLYILAGDTGEVLFQDPLSSFTANEEPIVADVDGDGQAEIVVTSDLAVALSGLPARTAGLRVYGDRNGTWLPARPTWNQHAYAIDNVSDDGGIPSQPAFGWLDHNTFRANRSPLPVVAAAADATLSYLRLDTSGLPTATVTVRLGNGGALPLPPGLPVALYAGQPESGGTLLAVSTTSEPLAAGAHRDLDFPVSLPSQGQVEWVAVANDDGAGGSIGFRDCRPENDRHGLVHDVDGLGLWLRLEDGVDTVHAGGSVTYTLRFGNASGVARPGVELELYLPAEATSISASGSATVVGQRVEWSPGILASGAGASGTGSSEIVSFVVDPAIPASVETLTVQAAIRDDGTVPEPSPWERAAVDINRVSRVRAVAGGPYAGSEGSSIALDGSASTSRDGAIASWEWDLDADGVYDDASGASPVVAFEDDGTHPIGLRVTDTGGSFDTTTTEVVVSNVEPTVSGGTAPPLAEGQVGTFSTTFSDPGAADTHAATADWGDGAVVASVSGSSVSSSRSFGDNGSRSVEFCVDDDDGGSGCASVSVEVQNAAPVLTGTLDPGTTDLGDWQAQHRHPNAPSSWVVDGTGEQVEHAAGNGPSVLWSPLEVLGNTIEMEAGVFTLLDGDFVGMVLGFEDGDFATPDADYLLIDWKAGTQNIAGSCLGLFPSRTGLAVSRVRGIPHGDEFWARELAPGACEGASEERSFDVLARGATYGDRAWSPNRYYRWKVQLTPGRLRVWIDGSLQIDVEDDFSEIGPGFGFYDLSMQDAYYRLTSAGVLSGVEGDGLVLYRPFTDAGWEDTHGATVDWGDGQAEPIPAPSSGNEASGGSGSVEAVHAYLEDGSYTAVLCVRDDDHAAGGNGEACESLAVTIDNAPPVIEVPGRLIGYVGSALDLQLPFADPGILDTHAATIDWGDGAQESLGVVEANGSGTLEGQHVYATTGAHASRICIGDDDGAETCEDLEILWLDPRLDLAVDLLASQASLVAGESMHYTLRVVNRGTLPITGITVDLALSAELVLLAGDGAQVSGSSLSWTIPELGYGEVVIHTVMVQAPATPGVVEAVTVATVTDDGSQGPDLDSSNDSMTSRIAYRDVSDLAIELGVDLARDARSILAGSYSASNHGIYDAIDGDPASYWLPECTGDDYLDLELPHDASVLAVAFTGVAGESGPFDGGQFQLYDGSDALVWSSSVIATGVDSQVIVDIPNVAGVRRIRLVPTAGGCGGLGDLRVLGSYGDERSMDVAEGFEFTLLGAAYTAESATASIDWGDGASSTPVGVTYPSAVLFDAVHSYPDDGPYTVEMCITTSSGAPCRELELAVVNIEPRVLDGPEIHLAQWQAESFNAGEGLWVLSEDDTVVTQTKNQGPLAYYGDFEADHARISGFVRTIDSDNDQVGFLLGYDPGEFHSETADYLLLIWKGPRQWIYDTFEGLVLARVTGAATAGNLFDPVNSPGEHVELLARGASRGYSGWSWSTDHEFTFEILSERLRISVNGTLEFDLEVDLEATGRRLAFYNHSQKNTIYRAFEYESLVADEGELVDLDFPFFDPGTDTFAGTVDWGDGTVDVGTIALVEGEMGGDGETGVNGETVIGAEHVYADDTAAGEHGIEVCVDDDDGGRGCGTFGLVVRNVAPVVEAGPDAAAGSNTPWALDGALYTDVGTADSHTATVDWGDGTTEPATVVPGTPGTGTVSATHVYTGLGSYTLTLCVTDDDGGEGCDSRTVTVSSGTPPSQLVLAPSDPREGELLRLEASFYDADTGDTHSATVDWGDGSPIEAATVVQGSNGGTVEARHLYIEEGPLPIEVCVTDSSAASVCSSIEVSNAVPEPYGFADLRTFRFESYPSGGSVTEPDWVISEDGSEVVQTANSKPSVLWGPIPALGTRTRARITMTGDDDFIGLALGFQPGDTLDPEADFLLLSWKKISQDSPELGQSTSGLELLRVRGVPANFWETGASPGMEPLARATNLGSVGWTTGQEYQVTTELTPERARVWVDGVLEIDISADPADPFDAGFFGIYQFAQEGLRARAVVAGPARASVEAEMSTEGPYLAALDFGQWSAEDAVVGGGNVGPSNWVVSDAERVEQTATSAPSFFYGPSDFASGPVQGVLRFPSGGNDYGGFAFGFDPGEATSESADYILVVWKQSTELGVPQGLRAYRVRGIPSFWRPGALGHAELLAEATNFGNQGWVDNRAYRVSFDYGPDRLRMWIDGVSELDYETPEGAEPLPAGRFALYTYSQASIRFWGYDYVSMISVDEGQESPPLRYAFGDAGFEDTHAAEVRWVDGEVDPVTLEPLGGGGIASIAAHRFLDEGGAGSELCITDDDGATGCQPIHVQVRNVAPTVNAGAPLSGAVGWLTEPAGASYADPGALDTHTATVDWGDGVIDALALTSVEGAGAIEAGHVYAVAGSYTLTLCVTDDDGDTSCDSTPVEIEELPPGQASFCSDEPFDALGPEWSITAMGDADGQASSPGGALRIGSTGSQLYHGPDNGLFVHRSQEGDFRIEVDVAALIADLGGEYRKACLAARTSTDPSAARAMVCYVPDFPGGPALQFDARAADGGPATELASTFVGVSLPVRLALVRRGDASTASYSLDGGLEWVEPVGGLGGTVLLEGDPQSGTPASLEVGMIVASYDQQQVFEVDFDDFRACEKPPAPSPEAGEPTICDPQRPLDLVYLVDLSESMTTPLSGTDPGAPTSKLDAALSGLGRLHDQVSLRTDGSRSALLTFQGFSDVASNLADAVEVVRPLSEDFEAVATSLASISDASVPVLATTPTGLALEEVLALLQASADPARLPIVVLVTDGVPNIDRNGRGHHQYLLPEIQAIQLEDGAGGFLPWTEVAWLGGFNGAYDTFDGEPLANAMYALDRLESEFPEVMVYGLGLEGDGIELGSFNHDLVDYAAWVTGGLGLRASTEADVLEAVDTLIRDLECGAAPTASLGDRVFNDLDRDGFQDPGEPGIAGVGLALLDSVGNELATATTDLEGRYLFAGVPLESVTVRVDPLTLPGGIDEATFDLDGGTLDEASVLPLAYEQRRDLDFGYVASVVEIPEPAPTTVCAGDPFEEPTLDGSWALSPVGGASIGDATLLSGRLELTSNGSALWGDDRFHFVYRPAPSGDFRAEVEIAEVPIDPGGSDFRKGGLQVRGGLDVRSPRIMVNYLPYLGDVSGPALQFGYRDVDGTAGQSLNQVVPVAGLPVRVAIEKRGSTYSAWYSIDDGLTWILEDRGFEGGIIDLDLGSDPTVGMGLASYDSSATMTMAFDDFAICEPDGTALPAPIPSTCDSADPLDVLFVLDLSGSMGLEFDGTSTRLEAARMALERWRDLLLARGDGSRAGLVVFDGSDDPLANLGLGSAPGAARLITGLGDPASLDPSLETLEPALLDPDGGSAAVLALERAASLLSTSGDPAHRPILVWIADESPTLDQRGVGPYGLEGLPLDFDLEDGAGGTLPPGRVAWLGPFFGEWGTFAGEPLANVMTALAEHENTLPDLRIYTLALDGDGVETVQVEHDLLEWMATYTEGSFRRAGDLGAVLTKADELWDELVCGGAQ